MTSIKNDTDLIAAVPALLRCVPTDSITILFFDAAHHLKGTARFDYDGFVEAINAWCADTTTNPMVGVATRASVIFSPATLNSSADIRSYCSALLGQVPNLGLTVDRILITTGFTEGRWVDVLSGDRGEVVDYRTSNIAASAVADGTVIAASETDIAVETSSLGQAYSGDPAAILSRTDVLSTISEHVKAHSAPTDPALLAASFASYVEIGKFRDSVFLILVDNVESSAVLFTTLARHARGDARAHLLAFSAMSSYLSGDNIRSRVVLKLCGQAAAGEVPHLAILTLHCLEAALSPAECIATISSFGQ